MKKEETLKILKNKVDSDDMEAGSLDKLELKIIREQLTQKEMDEINIKMKSIPVEYIEKYDELMPKEEMLEQAKKELQTLPDRIISKYD
jgi:hypothetical protein